MIHSSNGHQCAKCCVCSRGFLLRLPTELVYYGAVLVKRVGLLYFSCTILSYVVHILHHKTFKRNRGFLERLGQPAACKNAFRICYSLVARSLP